MENIKEKIFCYGVLEEKEKREVREYVQAHPSYAAMFEASLRREQLFLQARQFVRAEELDEVLYYYIHHKDLEKKAPDRLQKIYNQIETLLEQEPLLRDRYEILEKEFQGHALFANAEAHFKQLIGENEFSESELRKDRAPVVHTKRPAWRVFSGVFLIASVLIFLQLGYPTLEKRLAYLDPQELEVPGLIRVYRSQSAPVDQRPERLLADALITFDRAQVNASTKIIYYRKELLQEAESKFRRAIEEYETGSFLIQEAQFFLAKVLLAQGELHEARIILTALAQTRSQRASDASVLLESLQKRIKF